MTGYQVLFTHTESGALVRDPLDGVGFFDFQGEVSVTALSDEDGDFYGLVISAGSGGGPRVQVFDEALNKKADFFAFEDSFRGGVSIVAVSLGESGKTEFLALPGYSGGPVVASFHLDAHGQLSQLELLVAGIFVDEEEVPPLVEPSSENNELEPSTPVVSERDQELLNLEIKLRAEKDKIMTAIQEGYGSLTSDALYSLTSIFYSLTQAYDASGGNIDDILKLAEREAFGRIAGASLSIRGLDNPYTEYNETLDISLETRLGYFEFSLDGDMQTIEGTRSYHLEHGYPFGSDAEEFYLGLDGFQRISGRGILQRAMRELTSGLSGEQQDRFLSDYFAIQNQEQFLAFAYERWTTMATSFLEQKGRPFSG